MIPMLVGVDDVSAIGENPAGDTCDNAGLVGSVQQGDQGGGNWCFSRHGENQVLTKFRAVVTASLRPSRAIAPPAPGPQTCNDRYSVVFADVGRA